MNTYELNEQETNELNTANMNDLIRDCLGNLLHLDSKGE